jgi:hypothetical protein
MFGVVSVSVVLLAACGDDSGGGTPADRAGVGAECTKNADCIQEPGDGGVSQECLTQFKGGYCGIENCKGGGDCPAGSACVAHDDGKNYCFRLCVDKPECNLYRSPDTESNCVSKVEYVGGDKDTTGKACVPPSGG